MAPGCHPGPVSLSDDHSPPRRPLLFPVVIATVFLVIIGASAGYVLGDDHRRDEQAAQDATAEPPPSEPADPAAVACPREMRKTAGERGYDTALEQVLQVRSDDTGTTVWICADPGGELFYQSNQGGYDAKWIEGETALFLPGVEQRDGIFVATAPDGNIFTVTRTELRIQFSDGREDEIQSVREE